jgi:hypothetical protein
MSIYKCEKCGLSFTPPDLDPVYEAFEKVIHSALHHYIERDGMYENDECFHKLCKEQRDKIVNYFAYWSNKEFLE